MSLPPRHIHLWAPELSGHGGIQSASRALLRACAQVLPDARITVLVKNGEIPAAPGPEVRRFHFPRFFSRPVRLLAFSMFLIWHWLRHRPDLILITHLHFAPVAQLLHRLFGARFWVVVHGIELHGKPGSLRALHWAERVLAVSAWTEQQLRERIALAPAQAQVFPNTFDETRFFPAAKRESLLVRYGLTKETPILLTVARLDARESYKGCDRVLAALPLLTEEFPRLHYLIVGDGTDLPRLRAMAARLGLTRRVTFAGRVPDDELADHYRLCDAFVMPSTAEGFGIVHLEALACSKPVVAGRFDGATEPLRHGRLGVLIDPDDPGELADNLGKLLRGDHAQREICDPDFLSAGAVRHFGAEAYQTRLRALFAA